MELTKLADEVSETEGNLDEIADFLELFKYEEEEDVSVAEGNLDELADFLDLFDCAHGETPKHAAKQFNSALRQASHVEDDAVKPMKPAEADAEFLPKARPAEAVPEEVDRVGIAWVNATEDTPTQQAKSTIEAMQERGSTMIQCNVSRLDGCCCELQAPLQERIRWIKAQIVTLWGIPAHEQTLLCGTRVCSSNEFMSNIIDLVDENFNLNLVCIRSCSFRFLPELGHPQLIISDEGDAIEHGEYGFYQAGFLSDVLDPEDRYRTHIQFSSAGDWTMIFIGVAKDSQRDWKNLIGAYIAYTNRCGGFYIDDFHAPGWVIHETIADFFADHRQARTVDFIVSMDMPSGRLSCSTVDNVELASVTLDIADIPIRLAANVCHPGHKVRIVA